MRVLTALSSHSICLERHLSQTCEATGHPVGARGQRQHPCLVEGVFPVELGSPGQ
jgi:hypothetical protein